MAEPIANAAIQAVTQTTFQPDNGFAQIKSATEYQLAPYPIKNPTILLGIDAQPFTTDGTNITTVTFPALPVRDNRVNPIAPQQVGGTSLTIRPQDVLIFTAYAMNNDVHCKVSTRVLDQTNVAYSGQILAGGTYLAFQALVSSNTPTSGIIVGQLSLQRG